MNALEKEQQPIPMFDEEAVNKAQPAVPLKQKETYQTNRNLDHKEIDTHEISRKDFLILVVDDVVDNLVLISLDLQQVGFRVVTSSNGEEAIRVASTALPDLILMDIGMPELDGLGAARKLREHPELQKIPIIAITAFSTAGFRRAAYDAGFNGYLTKPINFDRLHDLIRSLLPVQ